MKKTKPNQIQLSVALLLLATTAALSAEDGSNNQTTQTTQTTTQSTGMNSDRNSNRYSDRTDDRDELYREKETSLDIFTSGSINQETIDDITDIRYNDDVEFGIGVGLNHFFTRRFGIGVEAYSEDTEQHFIDKASANLFARFPIGDSGFAPYIYGGGGRQFDPIELSFAQLGAGVEYRFTPKVGLFLDGRYVLTDGADNHGLARLGLRLAF